MADAVDEFASFAELFTEPLLLVSGSGELCVANAAARRELLAGAGAGALQPLADLVMEAPEKVREYLKLCLRSGQKLPGSLTARASGRKYHCEGAAFRDGGGPLVFLRMFAREQSVSRFAALNQRIEQLGREIRRRMHAERTAEQQREMLHVTLASIGDAVITTDSRGRVSFLNSVAERLSGWTGSDAVGRSLDEVFVIRNEETGEPVESPVRKVLREGRVVGLANHTVLLHCNGPWIPIDDSGAPIRDADGGLHGVVLVFHEISERRRLERELKRQAEALLEADRRKNQFLAMLGHELRNPLAPLTSAVQILLRQGGAADVERLASMMERQTAQLTRLVDDLLDIARITRGAVRLERRNVPLVHVLQHAVETVRPLIDERRHRLVVTPPPAELTVYADLARLSQVFCNLLNNAGKFMDPGGEITLTARAAGDRALVTVRDRGRGMEPAFLSTIFDLFSQEDRSLDRKQGGLGIGLTLVKTLVDMHGGEVTAASEGPGKGTEFVVALPLVGAPGEPARPEAAAAHGALAVSVLIVDDNRDAAESLAMLLEAWGCRVGIENDGAAAVARVRADPPDVVLLDIGLPGMDGFEVARRIRRTPQGSGLKIVAVTGYGGDLDRQRSEEAGFDDHLTKPVDFDRLRTLLAGAD